MATTTLAMMTALVVIVDVGVAIEEVVVAVIVVVIAIVYDVKIKYTIQCSLSTVYGLHPVKTDQACRNCARKAADFITN